MKNRWQLPDLGIGIGLRAKHVSYVLAEQPPVGFFELLSENYMGTGGRPLETVDAIADRYDTVLHGVSLSIGSVDPLDRAYLRELRHLAERSGAHWISDHLSWTGVDGINTHDLLPLPYNETTLRHVSDRVRAVSDFLGRPLILENPSTYLAAVDSSMPEQEFLARLCEEADCGLLLDINNVFVSCANQGLDPLTYLDYVPKDRVVQVHLAGHTDTGTHLLDTHSAPVAPAVWALYARFVACAGDVSTLLEWDASIPDFDLLWDEACKAERYRGADRDIASDINCDDAGDGRSNFEKARHAVAC
jgi:uncharacterized protein (UPF0276 family)